MTDAALTVLVVDDDPDVMALASMVLSAEGYAVLEAADGAEALTVLQAHPEIDLLFTDIVMPGGIDGFELAHRAKQLRPTLPVVYTSGYVKSLPVGQPRAEHGPLLQKPWRREQLRQMIFGQLGAGGTGSAGP